MALRARRAQHARQLAALQAIDQRQGTEGALPRLLIQAVVLPESPTSEGTLVRAVAVPWLEIVELFQRDPKSVFEFDWRKWEEIVAGAYEMAGFTVTLTPRSGDGGRDVIAEKSGYGAVRILDQVKRYSPGQLVDATDVRAMLGVLHADPRATKAVVSTTAGFAPGIFVERAISQYLPTRLELRDGQALIGWLSEIANSESTD